MLATRVRPISPSTAARHALASDEQLVGSIRDNDPVAFEALYERHQRELLSFCLYMLGSRADAEEALQATFASAYRALLADERPVSLRPWLFTIARNQCLSILRRRRPTVELGGEAAVSGSGDPFRELELREEVRHTLAGVRGLPERQRAAMVLAELHGLSQAEIGDVLGVRPEQVKALVYQARSSLISERSARDADCSEIREELASARGAALLKGKLRRHVRACPDCRTYADGVARRRRGFGAFVPLAPWLTLKLRALQDTLTGAGAEQLTYAGGTTLGGTVAGAALVAGGPIKAIAVKVAAGAALLGLSTGLGAPVLSTPSVHHAGSTVSLVSKPAWLPLLGEGESSSHGQIGPSGSWNGGNSGTPPGGQPPGGAGVPPLGGIEGGAAAAAAGMAAGAQAASGSGDGSGQHGGGSAAHHVAELVGGARSRAPVPPMPPRSASSTQPHSTAASPVKPGSGWVRRRIGPVRRIGRIRRVRMNRANPDGSGRTPGRRPGTAHRNDTGAWRWRWRRNGDGRVRRLDRLGHSRPPRNGNAHREQHARACRNGRPAKRNTSSPRANARSKNTNTCAKRTSATPNAPTRSHSARRIANRPRNRAKAAACAKNASANGKRTGAARATRCAASGGEAEARYIDCAACAP